MASARATLHSARSWDETPGIDNRGGGMALEPGRREQRAEALLQKTRMLLSVERWAEALESARLARRVRGDVDRVRMGLLEADALLGLERHAEVVELTTRLLPRAAADADDRSRLRSARATALWLDGRTGPARREAAAAAREAITPLTRGRAQEVLALVARHESRPDDALAHLKTALALFEDAGYALGVSRVFGQGARVLRDAGRFEEATRVHEHWADAARVTRRGQLGLACAERGGLLMHLGHWDDARRLTALAADEFRRLGDEREHTVAGLQQARLELAVGSFSAARELLHRARQAQQPGRGDPRTHAEIELLSSDLELSLGDAPAADAAARRAHETFSLLEDGEGLCRAGVRRVNALLAAKDVPGALRVALRARRTAPAVRRDLVALAALAAGRVLLRAGRASAADCCAQALAAVFPGHGLAHAASLGLVLARRGERDLSDVTEALRGLERWGDRRLLALCLEDLRMRIPAAAPPPPALPPGEAAPAALDAALDLVLSAACALHEGNWTAAARALLPVVPWSRVALVGSAGWELLRGRDQPLPLADDDPLRPLVAGLHAPCILRHADIPALASHPTTRLHDMAAALVAPVAAGAVVVEVAAGVEIRPDALALVAGLARLLPAIEPARRDDTPALPGVIGDSEPMRALVRDVLLAAAHPRAAVYILGETGTGKEKIAEALHRHSPRARGPFVPVNVAAIAPELFESEMFGHVKGAFTGALQDRAGCVEEAEGGTLFLDEVADLSPAAQAKLLRFLQSKEYRRVGETKVRRADVRIVSAANVPLAERVRENRFRSDILYRLATIQIQVPRLTERGDDVLLLARSFLREEAKGTGRPPQELTAEAARRLMAWGWPGNVRELQNEMARASVKAGRGAVRVEHLSADLRDAAAHRTLRTLREVAADSERRHIAEALQRHGGNRARTAATLGLSRQALVTKIGRLGLT
jgi:DNA-binding NtrC family response regulator/tetratricopeptide (TPR) repeat protein